MIFPAMTQAFESDLLSSAALEPAPIMLGSFQDNKAATRKRLWMCQSISNEVSTLLVLSRIASTARYSFFWSTCCSARWNSFMTASSGGLPYVFSRLRYATQTFNFCPSSLREGKDPVSAQVTRHAPEVRAIQSQQ